MRLSKLALALGLLVASCAWLAAFQRGGTPARSATPLVDYQREIRPIIDFYCMQCHSQDKRKGGLSLATYDDILEGGKDGPIVRPGKSAESLIVHRITGEVEPQMPKDGLPLDDDELALVRRWIDEGARATPTSPPAAPPWEAPLALERPVVPNVVWTRWDTPLDRLVAADLSKRGVGEPVVVRDALFARRAYLDVRGLLPSPEQLSAFLQDARPDKRTRLVDALLADNQQYQEHWISFWNDLLRNDDGTTYFSENASRKSITDWLAPALESNMSYDQVVSKLLNPSAPGDPEGFLIGVNWRGETSAAVTPWLQASQNTAQIFLGINLKCNSCHDSFISRWKLKDAYALAAYFAPDSRLQMYRCDVAQNAFAEPGFLFPQLGRAPASGSLADRRAAAAATFTDPRLGRLPRTLVNRIWQRLFGHGIVPNPDEMDGLPWSPAVLDWLASDFVDHRYDIKHLLRTILVSRAYQMPAVPRTADPAARGYIFGGPEVRRLTAEQFADAVGTITGEWDVASAGSRGAGMPAGARQGTAASLATSSGTYAREWRVASTNLTRALGRPIRDQVTSIRPSQATTLQALELVNGEILTRWLSRGARRMLGELPAEPASLYNRAVAGRNAASSRFDVDISAASRIWLVVQENGSNVPEAILPAWADAEFVGADGTTTPLSSLKPIDGAGLRPETGPIRVTPSDGSGVRVHNPSVLAYDISSKGFLRFRGVMGLENKSSDIGATLNPQTRFFIFDAAPNLERLVPPLPGTPLPANPAAKTRAQLIDRVFRHALGRLPTSSERLIAGAALRDPARPGRVSADGLADLLWAVMMKPEFQLIY